MAAAFATAFSTSAAAQGVPATEQSRNNGFQLGAFLSGSSIDLEFNENRESAGGAALHVGYGFWNAVSIFARANLSAGEPASYQMQDETFIFSNVEVGTRLSLPIPDSRMRPFLQGAVSMRNFSMDELESRGRAGSVGVGLEYFASPRLAVEAGLAYSVGEFDELRTDGGEWADIGAETKVTRLDVGLMWHP